MILANEKCPELMQEAINLTQNNFNKGISKVREILIDNGIKKEAEKIINKIFFEANKILNELDLDTDHLQSYSNYILNRKR